MSENLIGQEIETYCGKCKIDTLHLITAVGDDKIEKVMCKICMSYHKYKATVEAVPKPVKQKKATKSIKTKPIRLTDSQTAQLFDNVDLKTLTEYNMNNNYEVESKINHKIFGVGIVKNVVDNQKIQVIFRDKQRLLVQNYRR